ncbi:MAG: D-glycero-beta-D-manno-heptose 1-phosphate adenylyltransferase [Phycisphaerales bacterium]|nr:D-glycero-beta-D-manno-heptose 1-phosphate adenylyltransferase [Phycisphaerales bacterium]
MPTILSKLAHWRPFNALVVGDFMLDQLVYGDAERLTADAPVPVLAVRRTEQIPGGAANVCMDLAALHANVRAIGVTGADPEANLLRNELAKSGVDPSGLIADAQRPTTVKRNLIGLAQHRHPQKMFRVDYESREPVPEAIVARMLAAFDSALQWADVVAIEDYAKGACTEEVCQAVIRRARAAGKEVLIDPALTRDYTRYRGATAITPNRTEAELATGIRTHDNADAAHNRSLAHKLVDTLNLDAVVLTLDKHGAMLLERNAEPVTIPTVARQVYDVTGAGDMVLAAMMAARANNFDWEESVRFANAAAGLEVEIFGVKPIPFERVHQSMIAELRKQFGKQRTTDEAAVEAAAARREGKRVVFTNGCFDIIHAGHISLLQKARALGDMLIVGVNSDDSIRRLKGQDRPVHAERDRVTVLGALEPVDVIVVFSDDTPISLIQTIKPDILVKGADYTKDRVVGGDLVESWGGRVELVELLEGRSTTRSIDRIRAR